MNTFFPVSNLTSNESYYNLPHYNPHELNSRYMSGYSAIPPIQPSSTQHSQLIHQTPTQPYNKELEKIYELPSIKEKNEFLSKKKQEMQKALDDYNLEVEKERNKTIEETKQKIIKKNKLINKIKYTTDMSIIQKCFDIINGSSNQYE